MEPKIKDTLKTLAFRLPREDHDKLRIAAILRGTSLQELAREILLSWLKKEK